MSNTRPPMPTWSPAPQPPKKPSTSAVIIGSAAAVIIAVAATGFAVINSRDNDRKTHPSTAAASAPADTVPPAEEPTPRPSDAGPRVFGLSDTASYDSGVEVTLSGFTRKVSSEYASPSAKPYLWFVVKVKNGGESTVDAREFTVSCSYGKDGHKAGSIFDNGLTGGPKTTLPAGRSIKVPWGCALPKRESRIQIEVTPDYDSEAAIFTGTVT
jgi:hypothetical protein